MLGIEGTIDLVLARLQQQMAAKVIEVKARFNDDDCVLRAPNAYFPNFHPRIEAAQYPAVLIQPRGDQVLSQLNYQAGAWTYNVSYRMRIYVVERGSFGGPKGFLQVEQRRQRLTLALKEVLASNPGLGESPNAWIDVPSFSTTYFGLGQIADDKDNRSIAGTATDLAVIVEEMTEPYQPSTATAQTIQAPVASVGTNQVIP